MWSYFMSAPYPITLLLRIKVITLSSYFLDKEAIRIKHEVETGRNHHLFAQYISDKEKTEEEQRMSYIQKWSNFISYKYNMLSRR